MSNRWKWFIQWHRAWAIWTNTDWICIRPAIKMPKSFLLLCLDRHLFWFVYDCWVLMIECMWHMPALKCILKVHIYYVSMCYALFNRYTNNERSPFKWINYRFNELNEFISIFKWISLHRFGTENAIRSLVVFCLVKMSFN